MTMLAGVFTLDPRHPIPDASCETIRRTLSRDPSDEIRTFRDDRVFLAKLDIGAYRQPALQVDPDGAVSMLVGEPLLALDDAAGRTRTEDLGLLHREWRAGRWELLRKVRGQFCAVHYDPETPALTLIADKLAIRPLYYWVGGHHVVFSTALRVLEAVGEVHKSMDFQGVTEIAYLRYALSRRTPYAEIAAINPAELVTAAEGRVTRSRYWRWDEIEPSGVSEAEMVEEGCRRFRSAVRCRVRDDTCVMSLLSGGLDSRSVVAMLRDLDVDVHTFNFAPPRTQDRVFGREFARRVGTFHEEITLESDWADMNAVTREVVDAWAASPRRAERPPERPMMEWGGMGGSVGLGHLAMNQHMVDSLRAGQREPAIHYWLREGWVNRKLMRPAAYKVAVEVLRQGINDELDDLHCPDPGRDYYLFLMFNDQRRPLYAYFENIDLHRLDLHIPFWDSDFLAWIVATPIDLCLGHKYYMRWLGHFLPAATSVPWQAYPDHEPCPLPVDGTLRTQWDDEARTQTPLAQKRRLLRLAASMLRERSFPRPILRRSYLRVASLVYRLGLRDYSYVILAAAPYVKYWVMAGGEWVLPGAG